MEDEKFEWDDSGLCKQHSGLCTKVKDDSDRIKRVEDSTSGLAKEIGKKISTGVLIAIVSIITTAILAVVSWFHTANQNKILKLEDGQAILQREIGDRYDKIGDKLDKLKDQLIDIRKMDHTGKSPAERK